MSTKEYLKKYLDKKNGQRIIQTSRYDITDRLVCHDKEAINTMIAEQRGNTSREAIVSETLKLFSLKGFHNTSINDIQNATHLSKGAFYNYFRSKEDIFNAVLSEARRVWRFQLLHNINNPDREIDKAKKIIYNFKNRYLKDNVHFPGGCVFITLAVELDDQLPHLNIELADGFKQASKLFKGFLDRAKEKGEIRPDVSTKHISSMIFSSILGTAVSYGTNKSKTQLNTHVEAMLQYLESIETKKISKI